MTDISSRSKNEVDNNVGKKIPFDSIFLILTIFSFFNSGLILLICMNEYKTFSFEIVTFKTHLFFLSFFLVLSSIFGSIYNKVSEISENNDNELHYVTHPSVCYLLAVGASLAFCFGIYVK